MKASHVHMDELCSEFHLIKDTTTYRYVKLAKDRTSSLRMQANKTLKNILEASDYSKALITNLHTPPRQEHNGFMPFRRHTRLIWRSDRLYRHVVASLCTCLPWLVWFDLIYFTWRKAWALYKVSPAVVKTTPQARESAQHLGPNCSIWLDRKLATGRQHPCI